MKRNLTKGLFFFPLLLGLIPLTGCTKKENTLTVAEVTHSIFYAPMYVAKNAGYFEEEGIDIDIITTPGTDKVMAALISKEADIGLMGPEATVYNYVNGNKDYAINFAQLTQKDGSFILGRDPIEDFSYEMLIGKTIIGGRKGGMPLMTLEHILREKGIEFGENDPSKAVNIRTDVSFDAMTGVFVTGESDFVTAFEPVATQVEKLGKGYILTSLGQDSGEIPYTCFSSLKSYMDTNEEKLVKFSRAIKKGLDFIQTRPIADIIPYLSPDFTSSDQEELTNVMTNYLSIEAWPKTPSFSKSSFEKLVSIVKEAGELDSAVEVPFDTIVTDSILKQI